MGPQKSKKRGFFIFNPNLYWKRRGKYYLKEFEEQSTEEAEAMRNQDEAVMQFLGSLRFDSVLDVGCGFGRITRLIDQRFNCSRVVGIDLSEDQIANARKYAGDQNIEFVMGNVLNVKMPDESFDLVFSCTLLMHISPKKVKKAISETIRLSKQYVVNVDWYEGDYRGPRAQHNWCHDYFDLYGTMGFRVQGSKTQKLSNQYLFCLDKKKEG